MPYRLPIGLTATLLCAGLAFADQGPTSTQSNGTDSQTTTTARSRPRIRLGGISVGVGYSHWSGPAFYPWGWYPSYGYRSAMWGPYGWPYAYDPFFYGPYFHPGYLTGFGYHPSMGEVRLKSEDKEAWVYLDGALAGKAEKLKNMWLDPGVYNIEVRSGQKRFSQKVYVLSGKTLRLTADPERMEVRP